MRSCGCRRVHNQRQESGEGPCVKHAPMDVPPCYGSESSCWIHDAPCADKMVFRWPVVFAALGSAFAGTLVKDQGFSGSLSCPSCPSPPNRRGAGLDEMARGFVQGCLFPAFEPKFLRDIFCAIDGLFRGLASNNIGRAWFLLVVFNYAPLSIWLCLQVPSSI